MDSINSKLQYEFKLIFSNIKRKYDIDINISISNFIKNIKNLIKNDNEFNILDNESIEIIQAGLPKGENDKCIRSTKIKFKDYFSLNNEINRKNNFLAFYIRKVPKLEIQDIIIIFNKKLCKYSCNYINEYL